MRETFVRTALGALCVSKCLAKHEKFELRNDSQKVEYVSWPQEEIGHEDCRNRSHCKHIKSKFGVVFYYVPFLVNLVQDK